MSARDFFEGEAMLDDDENEELADEYDAERPEGEKPTNHYDDSSEEDEDDDDEDATRAVCPMRTLRIRPDLLMVYTPGPRRLHCRRRRRCRRSRGTPIGEEEAAARGTRTRRRTPG